MVMKKRTISLFFVVMFVVSSLGTNAVASVSNDQVQSQHIREADGTSGQNTNAGSGVKTGHIQDGAVTAPKIADGAVTTNKITDGAVTDAKITGPISGTKISSTGLDADTVDGKHASDFAPATHTHYYGGVAVVAKSGGDYTDPVTAMNDVAAWCGTPSATNPCLLKIMPGVYDIGSNSVQMQQYVDIEGSGENITKVTGNTSNGGTVNGASYAEIRFIKIENTGIGSAAIFNTNSSSPKIINVTVSGQCGVMNTNSSSPVMTNVTAYATIGVYNANLCNPTMTNMIIKASGAGSHGVYNVTSSPTMTNIDITSTATSGPGVGISSSSNSSPIITNARITVSGGYVNYGISTDSSSAVITGVSVVTSGAASANYATRNIVADVTVTNSRFVAQGGTNNYGVYNQSSFGTVKIDNSTISGSTATVYSEGVATFVGNSKLDGGAVSGTGVICAGVYDENYTFLANTCP